MKVLKFLGIQSNDSDESGLIEPESDLSWTVMIKFQIRIRNGYFLDENIKLSLPVVNTEIVCCKKYFLKSQNFSISFNNDQDNDRIEVRSKVKLRLVSF